MNDGLNMARGVLYGLALSIAVWATLAFAVLAVIHGWPYTPLALIGICAIGALLEATS